MDLYYIIKQYITFINPTPGRSSNNPDSSSSNNTDNNPNKDPGSGVGFKNVDEDKKEKKNIFDFSKLDDLLNKNKKLFEENKKSVTTLENERHIEELKGNINVLYDNQLNIIKKHVDHMNKVNDVFSSKNRSEAKSILHKIRDDLGKHDNLRDDFLKSLDSNTEPPKILSFLTEQNNHLLHNNILLLDLEKISIMAIEKDVKKNNLKDSELKMFTFVRNMQLNQIGELHKINVTLTGDCLSLYFKLGKSAKSNK